MAALSDSSDDSNDDDSSDLDDLFLAHIDLEIMEATDSLNIVEKKSPSCERRKSWYENIKYRAKKQAASNKVMLTGPAESILSKVLHKIVYNCSKVEFNWPKKIYGEMADQRDDRPPPRNKIYFIVTITFL